MSSLIEMSRYAANWLNIRSKRGVSAIEYGLLAALIALVIIGAVTSLGGNLQGVFNSIATKVHS